MVYVLVAAGGERATCLSDCSNIRDVFLRCIPRKATAHAQPTARASIDCWRRAHDDVARGEAGAASPTNFFF